MYFAGEKRSIKRYPCSSIPEILNFQAECFPGRIKFMKIVILFGARVVTDVKIGFGGNNLSQLRLLIFCNSIFICVIFICDFDSGVNDYNCNSLYLWW